MNTIQKINDDVNKLIEYKPDRARDYWQSMAETLTLKTGDCEDIALAKFYLLTAQGYNPYLAACKIMGQMHMVCVCDDMVLDNVILDVQHIDDRDDLIGPLYRLYIDRAECNGEVLPISQFSKWEDWLNRVGLP